MSKMLIELTFDQEGLDTLRKQKAWLINQPGLIDHAVGLTHLVDSIQDQIVDNPEIPFDEAEVFGPGLVDDPDAITACYFCELAFPDEDAHKCAQCGAGIGIMLETRAAVRAFDKYGQAPDIIDTDPEKGLLFDFDDGSREWWTPRAAIDNWTLPEPPEFGAEDVVEKLTELANDPDGPRVTELKHDAPMGRAAAKDEQGA